MNAWASGDIPSQAGKLAVITGANSGIGYFTALELAKAGANVILACRNAQKGAAAAAKINAVAPGRAVFDALDLASLASVHDFAARFKAAHGTLDLLINNAGVMAPPARQTTADGFELQFGVNFLGHFALTALLLPALIKAPAPRVIQLSSIAHRQGRIDLTDLQSARAYKPWQAYSQSKLAMLMFAMELQRRADAGGWGLLSLAAHPGIARTELIANGPGAGSLTALGLKLVEPFISRSGAAGALSTLLAATAADVAPGGYYGPTGFREFRGPAGKARPEKHALDAGVARALWEAAEALTGLRA
ncbi:oxidoreductase [Acidocella sp.]|uniref:oxidoreductase n=1 Tax=Acidocella sp. TaxID=50710 RepID=UPI0026388F21|nr:oxidoreductase [Acidocella sp.]MDD2795291.1 oxidoreductase [Acidocella sp.]